MKVYKYNIIIIISFVVFAFVLKACVEPYSPKTDVFESVLVVDADLTNIQGQQKVVLTRLNRLETDSIITESNANIKIVDELNHTYLFSESEEPGVYFSNEEFRALPNIAYTLYINTSIGEQFQSRAEYLTPSNQITDVYAEMLTTNEGVTGVQVYVDSDNDALGDARYIRYKFEETYKIKTPNSINKTMKVVNVSAQDYYITYDVKFTTHIPPRPRICYTTLSEKRIIQVGSGEIASDGISRFPIRFISPDELHMIKEKYSINITQIAQSQDAYHYYKTLNKFSGSESLLTDYQTGFVQGNIYSIDEDNKVVGFFDVSSVYSKRIFFNYESLNIDEPLYFSPCTTIRLDYRIVTPHDERSEILFYGRDLDPTWDVLDYENIDVFGELKPIITFVNPECGDCSKFSNPLKPEFWED